MSNRQPITRPYGRPNSRSAAFSFMLLGAAMALVACSGAKGSSAALVSVAETRLNAQSRGQATGNPGIATSLSSGDAATQDSFYATALGAQIIAGDTTEYGFDTLSVSAYPLDGGNTDFIAFETIRTRQSGYVSHAIELYHRGSPADPWKADVTVYLNDNISFPRLKLTSKGGHLLDNQEIFALGAQPSTIANQYATAMDSGVSAGKLPPGSYVPSESTTGVVETGTQFLTEASNGTGSVHWTPNPGGQVVALTNGVLVFASAQNTENVEYKVVGTTRYFETQDPERVSFGGLLAPGQYREISETSLVDIAIVLRQRGLPDVVARQSTETAVTGTPVT